MIYLVVDNDNPEGRQRQLEEQVRAGFAKAVAATLEFICGGEPKMDLVIAWQEFAELHESAIKSSIDPKGIAIRIPELNRDPTSADHEINTLIRGALRVTAARLIHAGKVDNDEYRAANKEFNEGLMLMNAKLRRMNQ